MDVFKEKRQTKNHGRIESRSDRRKPLDHIGGKMVRGKQIEYNEINSDRQNQLNRTEGKKDRGK